MNNNNRKLGRKVTIEIFEFGYHTETQSRQLYKTTLAGNPSIDIYKSCMNTVEVKSTILSYTEGMWDLKDAFKGNKAEFVIVKINKRNTQKFIVTREEYRKCARRKLK